MRERDFSIESVSAVIIILILLHRKRVLYNIDANGRREGADLRINTFRCPELCRSSAQAEKKYIEKR
jgi:hypothetical protein